MKAITLAACALVTACIGQSAYMTEATLTSARIEPSASTAVVTFIRPSRYATTDVPTILDENGRFLGECNLASKFSVAMPAGHHVFVVWGENSDAVVADLAPGKRYFVEVSPTEGWTAARMHLIALTPHSKKWPELDSWLERTTTLVPTNGGAAYIESHKADALDRVQRGLAHLQRYNPVDLEKRTIRPEDGL